ncbi:hypothetical protein Mth01_24130 [Sphaerimonospora thailandensis]|uniref:Uncharacterized protein n=1 Tax=Sphaerimonospora thailandensis TaxID=795644 RepID=A0A8J3VZJ4_9ACTN|nr:hypothetical protein Mth01_24130 [Sphaerimonospora thailandensis]
MSDRDPVGREPPGPATVHGRQPDVVIRHEGEKVTIQVGVSQVCAISHIRTLRGVGGPAATTSGEL